MTVNDRKATGPFPGLCQDEGWDNVEWLVPRTQEAVAHVFGICVKDVRGPSRGRAPVALARQVAMYLSHVVLALSYRRIGALFGRDRSTANYACRVVEDRRDDPAFDMIVSALEELLRHWMAAGVALRRSLSGAAGGVGGRAVPPGR